MLSAFALDPNDLEVGVVENDPTALRGLTNYLEELGCTIAWTAQHDVEAREHIRERVPSVLIVDLRLYRESDSIVEAWDLIRDLRSDYPNLGIIIYSGSRVQEKIVLDAIRYRCSYLIKEDLWEVERETLASALLASYSNGSIVLSDEVRMSIGKIASRKQKSGLLTEREEEVLGLVAQGLSNEEIAAQLVLSVATVKTHVSNILSKLKVDSRGKAAEWHRQHADELGLE